MPLPLSSLLGKLRPLLNFTANKYVLIKDWRLVHCSSPCSSSLCYTVLKGVLLRGLQIAILVYVFVDIFNKASYLNSEVSSFVFGFYANGVCLGSYWFRYGLAWWTQHSREGQGVRKPAWSSQAREFRLLWKSKGISVWLEWSTPWGLQMQLPWGSFLVRSWRVSSKDSKDGLPIPDPFLRLLLRLQCEWRSFITIIRELTILSVLKRTAWYLLAPSRMHVSILNRNPISLFVQKTSLW